MLNAIQTSTIYRIVILSLFLGIPFWSAASDPIKGNGKRVNEQRTLKEFHGVHLNTYCDLEIICGEMPRVEVQTDENIAIHLKTFVRNGVLYIETKEWLQPTYLKVVVHMPYIDDYEQSGWSTTEIRNVQSEKLNIKLPTGQVFLYGHVNKLTAAGENGKIDAHEMVTEFAKVEQKGGGTMLLNVVQSLEGENEGGIVRYYGNPLIRLTGKVSSVNSKDEFIVQEEPAQYLKFKVKNASNSKRDYLIYGPNERPFSYGFPIRANSTRNEDAPVGTKIYAQTIFGTKGKLLLEVTEDIEGKTIILSK